MDRKRSVRRHRRYEQTLTKKCKDYGRKCLAFVFSNIGIIGLVVGYTVTGAFIFSKIEGNGVDELAQRVNRTRNETARFIWNLTHSLNIFNETLYRSIVSEEILKYQSNYTLLVHKGFDGTQLDNTEKWTLAGSFLYSLTVITTIGYGNIFPRTLLGKFTTIVYAIIGMPLFLLYLSNIGDVMAGSFKWIYANLCLCRWCPGVARRRAIRARRRALQRMSVEYASDESVASLESWQVVEAQEALELSATGTETGTDDSYDVQTVTVPVTVCLLIMVGYICGGALLFSKWEDWHFLDGSYFCFISLSTIGFGDIVPGKNFYGGKVLDLSFIFCAMYLMLGMALIAMCFNLMQEEVIHKIRTTIATVKYIMRCNR